MGPTPLWPASLQEEICTQAGPRENDMKTQEKMASCKPERLQETHSANTVTLDL